MPDDTTESLDVDFLSRLGHNPFLAGNQPEEASAPETPEKPVQAAPEAPPQAPQAAAQIYQQAPVTAEAISGGIAQALAANDAYRRQEDEQRRYWQATQHALANPPRIEDPEKIIEDPAAFAKKFDEGIRWAAQAGRTAALAEMSPALQQAQAMAAHVPALQATVQANAEMQRNIANGLARQAAIGEGIPEGDFDRLMPIAHHLLHRQFGDGGYWTQAINPTMVKEAVALIRRNSEPSGVKPQNQPRQPVSIGANAPSTGGGGSVREQIPTDRREALRAVEAQMGFRLSEEDLADYRSREWTE